MAKKANRAVSRILSEDTLSLNEARSEVPGKRVDKSTIYRWAKFGLGPKSAKIKLEAVLLGNQLITSKQALNRFLVARTASFLK